MGKDVSSTVALPFLAAARAEGRREATEECAKGTDPPRCNNSCVEAGIAELDIGPCHLCDPPSEADETIELGGLN